MEYTGKTGAKEGRVGDWMSTISGTKFYPQDPRPEEVTIEDIATALSNMCRFGGHVNFFYSVAQHSVLCSQVGVIWELEKLLHDASEAYLQDIVRPLKYAPGMEAYREYETKLELVIAQRFDIIYPYPAGVKRADNILLFTERRDVIQAADDWFEQDKYPPLEERIKPWSPAKARHLFLKRFYELTGGTRSWKDRLLDFYYAF